MVRRVIAVALAASVLAGSPALAVPTTPAAQDGKSATGIVDAQALAPAYYDLFDSLYAGVDQQAVLDGIVRATADLIVRNNAEVGALAAQQPDLRGKLAARIKPALEKHRDNMAPIQREETAQFMAGYLTAGEARTLANFYTSPLGKRALASASRNMNFNNSIAGAARTGEVSAADMSKDFRSGGAKTGRELMAKATPAELRQMIALMRTSAYAKFMVLQRDLPAFRARLENMPMDPALQAQAQADITEVLLDAREAAAKKP